MAIVHKPALPDVFGRKLSWRERFIKGTEWMFRPMPKTRAELDLEDQTEVQKRPKDTIRLNLDA